MATPPPTERRLRDSLALLRVAGRLGRVGGWAYDVDSDAITWSDEMFDILEWPTTSPPSMAEAALLHPPEYRPQMAEVSRRCLDEGIPFDVQAEIQTGRGRRLWIRSVGEAERGPDGRVVRMIGAFQDISEQRRTADALRALQHQLHVVLEQMPDAFTLLDRDWTFRYVNSAAERLMRRTRDELIGKPVWKEFPHAVVMGIRDTLEQAMRSNEPMTLEYHSSSIDRWIEVNAYPSDVGLATYFRDITARKDAEMALRASEERLRVLSMTTSDAIWEWDIDSGLMTWNEGVETLFGYRRHAMERTIAFWRDGVHPEDAERVRGGLTRSLACGDDVWAEEYRFRRVDGSYADVYDRARILRDEHGRATRMMGGITDVTERKRLEAQVLRAQRMESIGTLAGGMAHDLNNVLAPILLSLDVLRDASTDPDAGALLDTIQASAQRGADLVRQVLSFARGVEGDRTPMDVVSLVDEVRRLVLETFPKTIACRLEIAPDVWRVYGDRTQLHQVLMNLCVNARDAMPRGGVLTLSAGNRVLDALYCEQHPETTPGPYVVLQMADTGDGIPAHVREKMFEPFFTTKPAGSGTGLGLSTSLAIVRSHGGFIGVYSEPGRGTVFKVHLPADRSAVAAIGLPTLDPLPPGRGELVLVVDDEASVRTVAQRTLEHHGYRVCVAANGAEAVALFATHRAERPVVITDMTMPVMDGPRAVVALRTLDPAVRIIGSSGLGADGVQVRAAGVSHFVPKPYTAERLLRVLRQVIDEA